MAVLKSVMISYYEISIFMMAYQGLSDDLQHSQPVQMQDFEAPRRHVEHPRHPLQKRPVWYSGPYALLEFINNRTIV